MSAVTLVLQLLRPGDVILAAHDCYGGTQRLLRGLSKRGHFDVVFADLTTAESAAAIASRRPRVVWIETPSNPLLRITDVRRVVRENRLGSPAAATIRGTTVEFRVREGVDPQLALTKLRELSTPLGGILSATHR